VYCEKNPNRYNVIKTGNTAEFIKKHLKYHRSQNVTYFLNYMTLEGMASEAATQRADLAVLIKV
jgi:hypothetical protein